MNPVEPKPNWPESWQTSHHYDRLEVYGGRDHLGYSYAYEARRDATMQLIKSVVPAGSSILDIAAAQGNFSIALAENGYRVTWNDLRAELADYVRLKDDTHSLQYAPGNALELGFPALFDCVLIAEIIEHVAYPDRFLRSVATLVKPGGFVVLTTPNGGYFRNKLPRYSDFPDPSVFEATQFGPSGDDHIFLLHPDEIRRFAVASGLSVIKLEHFTNPLTHGHLKLGKLLPIIPSAVVVATEALSQRLPRTARERGLSHTAALLQKTSKAI